MKLSKKKLYENTVLLISKILKFFGSASIPATPEAEAPPKDLLLPREDSDATVGGG